MNFKTTINLKKFISILLCTIFISSILPSNLLNCTVFAAGGNNTGGDPITENNITVPVPNWKEGDLFFEECYYGKNKDDVNDKSKLTLMSYGADYNVDTKNKTLTLTKSFINRFHFGETRYIVLFLAPSQEALTAYQTNPDKYFCRINTFGFNLRIRKFQDKNNVSWNNLKEEYTYGDEPTTISFSGGSGSGAVTYKSSDESVAKINEKTGELTIVGVGDFHIIATKAADDNYRELQVPSNVITVHKRPVTITGE